MASVNQSARSAAKSSRGFSLTIALGTLLSCGVFAGSAWGLATALSAMNEASHTLSQGNLRLNIAVAEARLPQPVPKAIKSGRIAKASESEIRADELSVADIRMAHERSTALQLAMVEKRRKAEEAAVLAASVAAKNAVEQQEKLTGKPALVTALVEDVPLESAQPFDLVLAKEEAEADEGEAFALPSQIPLPETKPLIETVAPEQKPSDDKPAARASIAKIEPPAPAYSKPQRSLFGDLFSRKPSGGAWPGQETRVAIYDVSNATVYLPDGSKLRAHSGIGHMRDNPRYEHVTMKGPTPAGIYRLSMREKRFYGVEAIRMRSIDGRDPKNRTGLLTHTNLLRGQIGSHGCVAFQNYQPFLNAFKRGQINTLVVVPELPSSPTQLAALYRKAGA